MKISLVIVGCGGTGSVFIEKFSRYYSSLAANPIDSVVIIDDDIVEEKNLRNQSFISEDIGKKKAAVWAELFNQYNPPRYRVSNIAKAYGCFIENTSQLEEIISDSIPYSVDDRLVILIGACDNHACRLVMEDFFRNSKFKDILYFDSANEFDNGETVFAVKKKGKVVSKCRSDIFPDVLKGDLRSVRELSCEELNNVAPQHMLINQLAAMQLMCGLVEFLEKKIIPTGFVLFDTSFSTQHFKGGVTNGRKKSKNTSR